MRVAIAIRVYCAEPECEHHFALEIPLRVDPISAGSGVHMEMPTEFEVPREWKRHYWHVLCPEHNPEPVNDKMEPMPDIVERARALQSLAMDKTTTDGERENAWKKFGEIWEKYELPVELGLEEDV